MTEGLAWPPTKEDLERLYLVEKLSAAKIAKAYGLKYKNQKVAESTVLYQLKKNGIKRRGKTEHVRKPSPETVDKWVERYNAGESLKQIAGEEVNPVTVWNHLRKRGVPLREKYDALIKRISKHPRFPFSRDPIERAYLIGLRYGDLHVVRHGRAVRVRVSTTHPAMADLFESLFSAYGFVHRYPRKCDLTDFEWTLECDLDLSFLFLLEKPKLVDIEKYGKDEVLAFLAGLFDAEGSIHLHNKRGRYNPEAILTNTDKPLIELLAKQMGNLGLTPKVEWREQDFERAGISGYSLICHVKLWRFSEVQRFLQLVPLKHRERILKSILVLSMGYRQSQSSHTELVKAWRVLVVRIRRERDEFIEAARNELNHKHQKTLNKPLINRKGQD